MGKQVAGDELRRKRPDVYYFSRKMCRPGRVVQSVGVWSHAPKGLGFSPGLGCVREATA